MRRVRLAFFLPILLLLAQHGAVMHQLSHAYYASRAAGSELTQDEQLPDNGVCVTCHAFGQLANPICASLASPALPLASLLRVPDRVYSMIGAKAPTARSRGPPQVSV
jgi:hypothetical protein